MNKQTASISINVSLGEIYERLCPSCREALIDLLGNKAADQGLRHAFRAQLERQPPPPLAHEPQNLP